MDSYDITLIVKRVFKYWFGAVRAARPYRMGACEPDVIVMMCSCCMLDGVKEVPIYDIGNLRPCRLEGNTELGETDRITASEIGVSEGSEKRRHVTSFP